MVKDLLIRMTKRFSTPSLTKILKGGLLVTALHTYLLSLNALAASDSSECFESPAPMLRSAIESFSRGEGTILEDLNASTSPIRSLNVVLRSQRVRLLGIHTETFPTIEMVTLKTLLLSNTRAASRQYTQFVGDTTTQFTVEGTIAARDFIKFYADKAGMIGYGFTGYRKDSCTRFDGNSILSTLFEEDTILAKKAVANIVVHNVVALEEWDCCWVTNNVSTYLVVYNDAGMGEGFTKFGSDLPASDGIFSKEDNDLLIMTEGGPQSFMQACNALRTGIKIQAMYGLRTSENLRFFSASEFFALVQRRLCSGVSLAPKDVREIMDEYLTTHEAWNKSAVDADTKHDLFYAGAEAFWKEELYNKLLTLVNVHCYIKAD